MRAATPGTVLVLAASVCLLLATISTPIIKNFSFLQASAANSSRVVRLGCLGYCAGGTCSPVTLGYDLDGASTLLGVPNLVPANWSNTIIKGLTYTLVLHPVALGAAVAVLIMGLISHCTNGRACCTGVMAGLASSLAILAFGLDCALFIIAKKRIESEGGTATLGAALWLTLAAAVLLFVSTCAFSCGSCCGGGGGRREKKLKDSYGQPAGNGGFVGDQYGERMRMDAIEAERRRKNGGEADLPKFAVYETEHVEHLPAQHEEQTPLRHDYYDHSQQNYAPYGQETHHDPYAAPYPAQGQYDNSPVTSYAAGVGPGHRRGPSQPSPGMAGYGAHAPARAGSTAPSAVSHDAVYTPGVGPQPYRDGTGSGFGTPATMAAVGAGAAAGYAAYDSPRRQPTADSGYHQQQSSAYGHPTEGTFGMPVPQRSGSTVSYANQGGSAYGHDAYGHDAHGGSAYGHGAGASSGYGHAMSPSQTMDAYGTGGARRAPSQVGPAGGSRRLPTVPIGDADSRRQPTADDGFGLAVLQAGAAARSRDEEQLRSPTSPHEDAHRAAVDAAFSQHLAQHNQQTSQHQQYGHPAQQSSYHDAEQEGYAYGGEEHAYYAHDGGYGEGSSSAAGTAAPPGYDWHDQQGHSTSGYPQEKR